MELEQVETAPAGFCMWFKVGKGDWESWPSHEPLGSTLLSSVQAPSWPSGLKQ